MHNKDKSFACFLRFIEANNNRCWDDTFYGTLRFGFTVLKSRMPVFAFLKQSFLCFPQPATLNSNPHVKIQSLLSVNHVQQAPFNRPCQTFTSPSGQMCVPAETDSSNPMSQPPTSALPLPSLSLCVLPLSTVLSFTIHLSVLAEELLLSTEKISERVERGWPVLVHHIWMIFGVLMFLPNS